MCRSCRCSVDRDCGVCMVNEQKEEVEELFGSYETRFVGEERIDERRTKVTFALPDKYMVLGLPVGKHVKIYGKNVVGTVPGEWNGRETKRQN